MESDSPAANEPRACPGIRCQRCPADLLWPVETPCSAALRVPVACQVPVAVRMALISSGVATRPLSTTVSSMTSAGVFMTP